MSQKQYRYEVQGRGDFPWDMLRYDRVYPVSDPAPSQYDGPEAWRAVRTVEVEGQGCTPDRWASFGWSVVPEKSDNLYWPPRIKAS